MADWYNASWLSRELITIDHTKVSGTLSNFPVCFDINDANLDIWTKAQANGNDILFTLSDGTTKLSHELSKYDNSGKELISYVEVPTLSNSVDTGLYMYYANAGCAAQEDVAGTWGANAKGIWHFEGNANASVGTNGVEQDTSYSTGKIGQMVNVAANGDYIDIDDANLKIGDADFSWRFLAKTGSTVTPWQEILRDKGGRCLVYTEGSNLKTYASGISKVNSTTLSINTWYYFALTHSDSGPNVYLYVNGNKATHAIDPDSIDHAVRLFSDASGNSYFQGYLCETRFNNNCLSDNWITTEYENLVNNSLFFTIGGEAEGLPPNIRRQLRSKIKSYNLRRREFVGN